MGKDFDDWVRWFSKEYGRVPSTLERECYFVGATSMSKLVVAIGVARYGELWRTIDREQ